MNKIITVDGPSGAGKGTLCYALAEKLGFALLDSGAIYRVTALAALKRNADLTNETELAELARHCPGVTTPHRRRAGNLGVGKPSPKRSMAGWNVLSSQRARLHYHRGTSDNRSSLYCDRMQSVHDYPSSVAGSS